MKQMKTIRLLVSLTCVLLSAMLTPSVSQAGRCQIKSLNFSMNTQSLTGGGDANVTGQRIGNWSKTQSEARVFNTPGQNSGCFMDYSWAEPDRGLVPGVVYVQGGKQYPVFETGVDGIGYALGIADTKSVDFTPLQNGHTLTYSGTPSTSIGFNIQVVFVAIGRLRTGSYPLSNLRLASLYARNTDGTLEGPAYITTSATINITARTCNVQQTNYSLHLPGVSVSTLNNLSVGAVMPGVSESMQARLSCDAGVVLYATMSDNNDPDSRKNYLSPGNGSGMAKGVGVQMTRSGSSAPISMGPDSSSPGTVNQWYIGTAANNASMFAVDLTARYVKTAQTVTPGAVRAVATITFSYQ